MINLGAMWLGLVNNYDINIKVNDAGQLEDMELVILETETAEESNDE